MVNEAVPRRPRPTKISTTGGISWAIGGYESPMGDDLGPSTPIRHSTSTPGLLRRYDSPDELERGSPSTRHASLNDMLLKAKAARGQIGIRDRIACFQWTWFTMTMVRPCVWSPSYWMCSVTDDIRPLAVLPMSSPPVCLHAP
jgi:hypothetical protein